MTAMNLENMAIFDLETTGLEADCKIVQIAIICGDRIFQRLVNPGIPIPAESIEIHHITDADVADAPRFEAIADEVLDFIQDRVLAGFNIRKFDVPVLKREVLQCGREFPALPILDLFELNQKMNPRSLAWFYQHYTGEPMDKDEAHDAVYDCICTHKGLLGMLEKHTDLPTSLMELIRFAEPDRIPVAGSTWLFWVANQCEPSLFRGKYRGWALSEVGRKEPSYLRWLCSIDADAVTKNIINLYQTQKRAYSEFLKEEHPLRWEPRYIEFRYAMESNDLSAFPELETLAHKTGNPSLLFLAAAWSVQIDREKARELAKRYMGMKDPNVNVQRRTHFLEKNLGL